MKVMVDFCLIPIGVGVSLSEYIVACQKLLEERGLHTELHAYGTLVEGEWDAVFEAVRDCHALVHEMGCPRIMSTLKVGTRVDRTQTGQDKLRSVREKLGP